MKLFVSVVLLTTSATVNAAPIETWECREYISSSAVLVTATVEPSRKRGTIHVAGVKHNTLFQVTGFDRRWDFGTGTKNSIYAFVIQPNGNGHYYDFQGKNEAKPSSVMHCTQIDVANLPN